ncbi:MAG: RluA family pseudouridine synthase [Pirellula sp.]
MIDILHEHAWFLVISKPFGLLSQAVSGVDSVQSLLCQQLHERNPTGPKPFVGIPHRLDRVTTGIMVVARNQRALRRLSDQFASRKVKKTYFALVPKLLESKGRWSDFLRKVPEEARAEMVAQEVEGAKLAILSFHVVSHHSLPLKDSHQEHESIDVSLVAIGLETGRMHQIRLQFAHRGFPIIGDQLYGSCVTWQCGQLPQREAPIALHAQRLEFHHPQSGELLSFEAPLPSGWPVANHT